MSAEELGDYITNEWQPLCTKLAQLEPYVRVAFERIDAGETIAGCSNKAAFARMLGRSYNAVKFMLAGGNPANETKKKERSEKPKHLTQLEHKLLRSAAVGHEVLVHLRAGHVEEAAKKLKAFLPTPERNEEYLERGVKKPTPEEEHKQGLDRRARNIFNHISAIGVKLAEAVIANKKEEMQSIACRIVEQHKERQTLLAQIIACHK